MEQTTVPKNYNTPYSLFVTIRHMTPQFKRKELRL